MGRKIVIGSEAIWKSNQASPLRSVSAHAKHGTHAPATCTPPSVCRISTSRFHSCNPNTLTAPRTFACCNCTNAHHQLLLLRTSSRPIGQVWRLLIYADVDYLQTIPDFSALREFYSHDSRSILIATFLDNIHENIAQKCPLRRNDVGGGKQDVVGNKFGYIFRMI